MPDLRPTILGLGISMPLLATAAVILRYQARTFKRVSLGADDYAIFVALVLAIGFAIDVMIDSQLGNLGGHEQRTSNGLPVANESSIIFAKTNFAAQLLWYPTVGVTKISILLFYKRIFIGRRFRILIWSFIGIVSFWMFAFFMTHLFACIPISVEWGIPLPGQCANKAALYTTGSVTDVLGDIAILTLPIYNVSKLQMPKSRKIAVMGIFLLGSLVTAAGVVRLAYVITAFAALKSGTADGTYIYAPAIFWTLIETSLGVVSACLPVLRPLYKAYSVDSLLRSARSLTVSRLLRSKSSSKDDRWRYSETGSERNRSSSSANTHDPYFTSVGLNGNQLPLNAYNIKVKGAQPEDTSESTEGIMVKSELSRQKDVV